MPVGMPRPLSVTAHEPSALSVTVDLVGMAGECLVDGVVDDFIDHVVQARAVIGVADIHARPLADGVEAFQHLDRIGAVFGRGNGGGGHQLPIGSGWSERAERRTPNRPEMPAKYRVFRDESQMPKAVEYVVTVPEKSADSDIGRARLAWFHPRMTTSRKSARFLANQVRFLSAKIATRTLRPTIVGAVASALVALAFGPLVAVGQQSDKPVAEPAVYSEIGSTLNVANEVNALEGPKPGIVTTGDVIFQNEVIETGQGATAEFRFADETVFAMSQNSKIKLDEFVYDPAGKGIGKLAVTAIVGSFRFVSGKVPKDNISIDTPQGSIGVRGTVFDLYVAENGDTSIGLLEGAVRLCNRGRIDCRELGAVGRFLRLTALGVFDQPTNWSRDILGGVAFERAFPFIADQRRIGVVFHAPDATIGRFADFVEAGGVPAGMVVRQTAGLILGPGTGDALKKGVGSAGKAVKGVSKGIQKVIKPPKIKLPKLFKN